MLFVNTRAPSRGLFFMASGAIIAGLGVAIGAFGAHGLADSVTPERLDVFETGTRYHMYHALALLFVGWAADRFDGRAFSAAGGLFLAGILLFSGSLYLLVLTDTRWLGVVTPLGGLAFITGWVLLGVKLFLLKQRKENRL